MLPRVPKGCGFVLATADVRSFARPYVSVHKCIGAYAGIHACTYTYICIIMCMYIYIYVTTIFPRVLV